MYIKIRAFPGSKKENVEQTSDDHFEIHVKEEAEQNLANRRIVEIIASRYKLPVSKVRIISGHRSPGKILSVDMP